MGTKRILITGGPGSGCTSTAAAVGELLSVRTFDSDTYFHKPTDPPFQEQYTPDERPVGDGHRLKPDNTIAVSGAGAFGLAVNEAENESANEVSPPSNAV